MLGADNLINNSFANHYRVVEIPEDVARKIERLQQMAENDWHELDDMNLEELNAFNDEYLDWGNTPGLGRIRENGLRSDAASKLAKRLNEERMKRDLPIKRQRVRAELVRKAPPIIREALDAIERAYAIEREEPAIPEPVPAPIPAPELEGKTIDQLGGMLGRYRGMLKTTGGNAERLADMGAAIGSLKGTAANAIAKELAQDAKRWAAYRDSIQEAIDATDERIAELTAEREREAAERAEVEAHLPQILATMRERIEELEGASANEQR